MSERVPSRESEIPLKDDLALIPEGRIKTLEGNNKKAIRIEHSIHEDTDDIIAEIKEAQKEFRKLERKYGIQVIDYSPFVGKDEEGKKAVYMLVDKIEGSSLSTIEHIPQEKIQKFEEFFLSFLRYVEEKFKEEGLCFLDIKNDQFVYGHKVGQKKDEIYLVDVEPKFHDFKSFNKEEALILFERTVEDILTDIEDLEKRFIGEVTFREAREKGRKLLSFATWLRNLRNQSDEIE